MRDLTLGGTGITVQEDFGIECGQSANLIPDVFQGHMQCAGNMSRIKVRLVPQVNQETSVVAFKFCDFLFHEVAHLPLAFLLVSLYTLTTVIPGRKHTPEQIRVEL